MPVLPASPTSRAWRTPREADLGLVRIESASGLAAGLLPDGGLFGLEHRDGERRIQIGQLAGSALGGGIFRLGLRIAGSAGIEAVGPGARGRVGAAGQGIAWAGETRGLAHRASLTLLDGACAWLWRLELENRSAEPVTLAARLVQDLGLGERGFLTNNEAYASHYIDHHIAAHPTFGPVVMSRQNLAQGDGHPWVAHACLDGAAAFATDGLQVFGPAHRGGADAGPLPAARLQHELACAALETAAVELPPGGRRAWRFLAVFLPDHPAASSDADLAPVEAAAALAPPALPPIALAEPARSLVQAAPLLAVGPLDPDRHWPERRLEEWSGGRLLSFFTDRERHVVLRDKELVLTRRHGSILRSGTALLPDDGTMAMTCWMQGIFAAQLTLGNTSFHKLLAVSREPYGITRAGGLRILVDEGDGWRRLAVPSAFEMGLSDCRWLYRTADRLITVTAVAAGADPAMQWRIAVEGAACRFLVYGQLVLGERELDQAGRVEIGAGRASFRPDPDWLWGQRYPEAVYHLVSATPAAVEALGGDELLWADGGRRDGSFIALLSRPTDALHLAVVGSLTEPAAAAALAERYAAGIADAALLAPAADLWRGLTRGLRLSGGDGAEALDAVLPWLAHDMLVHLSVPHGLEQYTGAAWGTRDVCQGPVEALLALEHDRPVKEILRLVFAQQYRATGDWPQWFMHRPYQAIQDRTSHGDVIIWPLKALCDYVEATGDLGFLDEPVAWRDRETLEETAERAPVGSHVDRLLETVRARAIPGTSLMRLGEGDWNDALQPADPALKERLVSSWTVALLHQQLGRYAAVLRAAGRDGRAVAAFAAAVAADIRRHLIRDGVIAGYGLFGPEGAPPELLLHPSDRRTGLRYSLLPMTQGLLGGLFTPAEAAAHLALIREHLSFPDGFRLLDRPAAYHGGPEILFRRAESAAFFGREIGLMYVHAHLRQLEALAGSGAPEAAWAGLRLVDPAGAGHLRPHQRNAYFSSSDAAFADRYAAAAEWGRVAAGTVPLEAGWRIYSSGPGLMIGLVVRHLIGRRRWYGRPIEAPALPAEVLGGHFEAAPAPSRDPGLANST